MVYHYTGIPSIINYGINFIAMTQVSSPYIKQISAQNIKSTWRSTGARRLNIAQCFDKVYPRCIHYIVWEMRNEAKMSLAAMT